MRKHPSLTKNNKSHVQSSQQLRNSTFKKKSSQKLKLAKHINDDTSNVIFFKLNPQQLTKQKQPPVIQKKKTELCHYHEDIQNYLFNEDMYFHCSLNQFRAQPLTIDSNMRSILVKWIIEVSDRFGCSEETLHLAVQLIDILILKNGQKFDRRNFQLLGISSLFIACKYNQIKVHSVERFLYVCDGLYTLNNLLEMESLILQTLNFNLNIPTIHNFILKQQNHRLDKIGENFMREFSRICLLDFSIMNNFTKAEFLDMLLYFTIKITDKNSRKTECIVQLQKKLISNHKTKKGIGHMLKLYQTHGENMKFYNQ